ncbi:hypothetical protein N7510_011734 [Penicillium lagena]|uniref:uncharacterized protein n=1 Tax=Penicillium lagena TaxID=94218 RepID=UPI002541DD37|nr:uncharacterized protein N7510_011734 [Penicillium lagena]KAJ5602200.1 hypothetical protein N7510_011734 [Penicillium lagena]
MYSEDEESSGEPSVSRWSRGALASPPSRLDSRFPCPSPWELTYRLCGAGAPSTIILVAPVPSPPTSICRSMRCSWP